MADAGLIVRPLTAARWPDLERLFAAKGCSVARGCWCMFYRESGKSMPGPGGSVAALRKERLHALAQRDPPPGLLGYDGREPVGWVSLGPRADFPRLQRSPVARPVDDVPVWSIVCFVVPPAHRHRGVATALLAGAIAYARKRGVTQLEAYPVDKAQPGDDAGLWWGALSMYRKAGFIEVARRKPERPVVRLALKG